MHYIEISSISVIFFLTILKTINGLTQDYCNEVLPSDAVQKSSSDYMSNGLCMSQCQGYKYAIVQNESCWCSDDSPQSVVSVSNCDGICPGYSVEMCGSGTVYYGWLEVADDYVSGSSATSFSYSSIEVSSSQSSSLSSSVATSSGLNFATSSLISASSSLNYGSSSTISAVSSQSYGSSSTIITSAISSSYNDNSQETSSRQTFEYSSSIATSSSQTSEYSSSIATFSSPSSTTYSSLEVSTSVVDTSSDYYDITSTASSSDITKNFVSSTSSSSSSTLTLASSSSLMVSSVATVVTTIRVTTVSEKLSTAANSVTTIVGPSTEIVQSIYTVVETTITVVSGSLATSVANSANNENNHKNKNFWQSSSKVAGTFFVVGLVILLLILLLVYFLLIKPRNERRKQNEFEKTYNEIIQSNLRDSLENDSHKSAGVLAVNNALKDFQEFGSEASSNNEKEMKRGESFEMGLVDGSNALSSSQYEGSGATREESQDFNPNYDMIEETDDRYTQGTFDSGESEGSSDGEHELSNDGILLPPRISLGALKVVNKSTPSIFNKEDNINQE
ncbi:hypothetical protein QEN19_003885 [Hanseniaspora menglaensis]